MKKVKLFIVFVFCVFSFPFVVRAKCDYHRMSELNKMAGNVQISYTYELKDDSLLYTVYLNNLVNDMERKIIIIIMGAELNMLFIQLILVVMVKNLLLDIINFHIITNIIIGQSVLKILILNIVIYGALRKLLMENLTMNTNSI